MANLNFRIGHGIDVHAFVKGRSLILGGVKIPCKKGLGGHSDADVVIHAIMDALLGAAGLGDIGTHFPNTDPAYKNIASTLLLKRVNKMLQDDHYQIGNIDVTVLAQEPKIQPYIPAIRQSLAAVLKLPQKLISIKATTTEEIGAIGRKEGILAMASVIIGI